MTTKISNEIIRRTSPFGESRRLYYGMACNYTNKESEYITEITDLAKGKVISIDEMRNLEKSHKVIYLGNKIKVIITNEAGKSFTGMSICHEDDFFSPQKGYAIAYKKAQIKKLTADLDDLCK